MDNLSDSSTIAASQRPDSIAGSQRGVNSNQLSNPNGLGNQFFQNIPVDIPFDRPVDMAALAEAGIQFKPPRFSGEEGTLNIEDFLNALELLFPSIDRQFPNEAQNQRARGLTLQSYLDGPARQYNNLQMTVTIAENSQRTRQPPI